MSTRVYMGRRPGIPKLCVMVLWTVLIHHMFPTMWTASVCVNRGTALLHQFYSSIITWYFHFVSLQRRLNVCALRVIVSATRSPRAWLHTRVMSSTWRPGGQSRAMAPSSGAVSTTARRCCARTDDLRRSPEVGLCCIVVKKTGVTRMYCLHHQLGFTRSQVRLRSQVNLSEAQWPIK